MNLPDSIHQAIFSYLDIESAKRYYCSHRIPKDIWFHLNPISLEEAIESDYFIPRHEELNEVLAEVEELEILIDTNDLPLFWKDSRLNLLTSLRYIELEVFSTDKQDVTGDFIYLLYENRIFTLEGFTLKGDIDYTRFVDKALFRLLRSQTELHMLTFGLANGLNDETFDFNLIKTIKNVLSYRKTQNYSNIETFIMYYHTGIQQETIINTFAQYIQEGLLDDVDVLDFSLNSGFVPRESRQLFNLITHHCKHLQTLVVKLHIEEPEDIDMVDIDIINNLVNSKQHCQVEFDIATFDDFPSFTHELQHHIDDLFERDVFVHD